MSVALTLRYFVPFPALFLLAIIQTISASSEAPDTVPYTVMSDSSPVPRPRPAPATPPLEGLLRFAPRTLPVRSS